MVIEEYEEAKFLTVVRREGSNHAARIFGKYLAGRKKATPRGVAYCVLYCHHIERSHEVSETSQRLPMLLLHRLCGRSLL